jgi:CRP-like cAMP-binding protein
LTQFAAVVCLLTIVSLGAAHPFSDELAPSRRVVSKAIDRRAIFGIVDLRPPTPVLGEPQPVASNGFRCDRVITPERLNSIAVWSRDLSEIEREHARKGINERNFRKGATICNRGDRFDGWAGVVDGLVKVSAVTSAGDAVSLGVGPPGAWFGEGSVLKNEPRRYEVAALRDTCLAILDRPTFLWLFDNSPAFVRHLVHHLNERVSFYMSAVQNDRSFDPTTRLANYIAWLFNPILSPRGDRHIAITQEELGLLSGISRPMANKGLKILEERNLISVEHGAILIRDLEGLTRFHIRRTNVSTVASTPSARPKRRR